MMHIMEAKCPACGANISEEGNFCPYCGAKVLIKNEIKITEYMCEVWGQHYKSVELLFQDAGFTNINIIPVKDLNRFNRRKDGQIKSVTINGNECYEEGEVYPKNALVVITYHSV